MAKTFGLVRLLSRNDRIMRVGLGGALLYALTIALVSPMVSNAATAPTAQIQMGDGKAIVLRLSSLKPTLSALEAPGSTPLPLTVVRDEVVNRPAYQAYLREKDCLATAIYFDYDRYDIKPEARALLDAKLPLLRANPNVRIRIAGHADERGSDEYNLALGQRRAATLARQYKTLGVSGSQLKGILSFGEERPVCNESNESCWKLNRRGETVRK